MTKKSIALYALATACIIICCGAVLFMVWLSSLKVPEEKRPVENIFIKYIVPTGTEVQKQEESKITAKMFQTSYAYMQINGKRNTKSTAETAGQTVSGKENEITFGKIEPDKLPVSYTMVNYPYFDYPLYVYIDANGNAQYRAYAHRNKGGKTESGFIPVRQKMANLKITIEYDPNAEFTDPDHEPYGRITPVNADSEDTHSLIKEYGMDGTYYFINPDGKKEYVVYGHYPNSENGFFIADSNGIMIPGTLPIANLKLED